MNQTEKKRADEDIERSLWARGEYLKKIAEKMQEVAEIPGEIFKDSDYRVIPIFEGKTGDYCDDALMEWAKEAERLAGWIQRRAAVYESESFWNNSADALRENMKQQLAQLQAGEKALETAATTGAFGDDGDEADALESVHAAIVETKIILKILDGKTGTEFIYLDRDSGKPDRDFGNMKDEIDDADDDAEA